jgi:hypothetical protein
MCVPSADPCGGMAEDDLFDLNRGGDMRAVTSFLEPLPTSWKLRKIYRTSRRFSRLSPPETRAPRAEVYANDNAGIACRRQNRRTSFHLNGADAESEGSGISSSYSTITDRGTALDCS